MSVDKSSVDPSGGFALLNSLVALTILSLALVVTIRAYGMSSRAFARAADAAEASVELPELLSSVEWSVAGSPQIEIVPASDQLVEVIATVETSSGQRFSTRTLRWQWEVVAELAP